VIAAVEYDTEMQEKSMCEEPQRKAKVTAIAEVLKLGFSGTEVVTTASIFAKEPNQMDMFLALPEIYKKDYILQMLSGMPCDPLILYTMHLTSFKAVKVI
jgi:hypothetical protein